MKFFQLPPYCSFVAVKYDSSNMSGMTVANTLRDRNLGRLWEQWFVF